MKPTEDILVKLCRPVSQHQIEPAVNRITRRTVSSYIQWSIWSRFSVPVVHQIMERVRDQVWRVE